MHFDDKKREFIITDMFPRRPLVNYLWNENVVWSLDQFGNGKCLACIGSERRTITDGKSIVYVKISDGEFFSPTRNFKKENFEIFETHVGLGYHEIVGRHKGIETITTFTLPESGYSELMNVSFENVSAERKSFTAYVYLTPFVNVSDHTSYSRAEASKRFNGITFSQRGFALFTEYNEIFVTADRKITAFEVTKDNFVGVYSDFDDPDGVKKPHLSSNGATFDDNFVCALQFEFSLEKGEKASVNICVGLGKTECEAFNNANAHCSQTEFARILEYQKRLHDEYNSVFMVNTPDEYFNRLVNVWLKTQVSLGKTWGRVYGKGFRDVMQDICGFVSMDTPLAKKRILHALKYQFINGNTIRMFDPIFDEPYNDGAAWIPTTVLYYLRESGDFSILDERVGYYDSDETDTVFDHLKRGMDYLTTCLGKHGLVLWLGGDWNDSLNNCGRKGIGESVWLSIATIKAVKDFIVIAEKRNVDCGYLIELIKTLTENVYKYGFEGDRFIYGYNDYNEKIGSKDSEQAKLYLNPQSWAVLAGIADEKTAKKIFETVDKKLKCKFGFKQCDPSYHAGSDKIGRASYFVEGLVENGAVYNHGVTFKIAADCVLKDGNAAYNDFLLISPLNPANPNNGMEAYAISNMYIGDECPYKNLVGYAPMSWITGTAGWLYRDFTEGILGVSADFDGLKIEPHLPDGWKDITITRIFRNAKYNITIKRGVPGVVLDGKRLIDNVLVYDGNDHEVTVYREK